MWRASDQAKMISKIYVRPGKILLLQCTMTTMVKPVEYPPGVVVVAESNSNVATEDGWQYKPLCLPIQEHGRPV
jgi:hypothetical protein